jgi:cation diffusion facilitator family transporter
MNRELAAIEEVEAYRIGQRVAMWSIAISAGLAAIKVSGGVISGSMALLADGVESASDMVTSAIVLSGMAIARKPADEKFPYGYGRAESLAAKTTATVLLIFAALLGARSIFRFVENPPAPPVWALIPLAISFLVKLFMSGYKRRLGRRLRSSALLADATNDLMDVFSATVASAGILIAVVAPDRLARADAVGGLAVSAIIFYLGIDIFRKTTGELMDIMPEPELLAEVRAAATGVEGVMEIEKCYGRKSGMYYFFDLHVEVDEKMTVREAHDLAHRVQDQIISECKFAKGVLVHVEPYPKTGESTISSGKVT